MMNLKKKFLHKQRERMDAKTPPHKYFAIGFGVFFISVFIYFYLTIQDQNRGAASALGASVIASILITGAVAFYVWLAFIPASIGANKGYDFWTIFFASMLISWPIALLVVLLLPDKAEFVKAPKPDRRLRFDCPECGEAIPVKARVCRYCNAMLTDNDKKRA